MHDLRITALHRTRDGEKGMILIFVLVCTAAIGLLGIMASHNSLTELQITQQHGNANQALGIAVAGLNHAYELILAQQGFNNELASGGTGGALTSIGSVATLSGASYRFQAFGGGGSDGYYVQAQDDFDEGAVNDSTVNTNGRIYLVSRGRVRGAERVVVAAVGGTQRFRGGVWSNSFITLSGGSTTDSFDSRTGFAYNALTAGSNGDIYANGNIGLSGGSTVVKGDAAAHGTISASGGSSITGTQAPNGPTQTRPAVAPCGPPYSSATGISPSGYYTQASGDLTVSGGNTVTIANGTYCFASMTLSGGSTLVVNGPVVLNVTGAIDFSGGSVANTTSIASNVQINSSMNAPGNQNAIKLSGGSGAYMAVYAPNAGLTFSGGSNFYGAVVAASITNSGGTDIHFDEALAGLLMNLGMRNWHEVRN